jgi:hypothetical protein
MNNTVDKYRKAAVRLFGCSEAEARTYIVAPEDDPGQWAPKALAIIRIEPDCREEWDEGIIPASLDSNDTHGLDNCESLDKEAGAGAYIEYINAAVAAVWPN